VCCTAHHLESYCFNDDDDDEDDDNSSIVIIFCCVLCLALQLLPPSCFETLPTTNSLADFSQTVNDIVNILDEYNSLKYVQIPVDM